MSNRVKTHAGIAPVRTISEEEKKKRIMQFVQQKREAFAINILNGLVSNMGKDATNAHAKEMVALPVEMADELFAKLYPLPEEETKQEEESK